MRLQQQILWIHSRITSSHVLHLVAAFYLNLGPLIYYLVLIVRMKSRHESAIPNIFEEEILVELNIPICTINISLVDSEEEIFHFYAIADKIEK